MSERQRSIAREHMRRLWQDPDFRARMKVTASETLKRTNQQPEMRALAREKITRLNTDPAFIEKRLTAVRAANARPEVKARKAAINAERNRDPAFQLRADAGRKHPRLPTMSADEFRQYKKLRHAGVARQDALQQTFSHRYQEGMYR